VDNAVLIVKLILLQTLRLDLCQTPSKTQTDRHHTPRIEFGAF